MSAIAQRRTAAAAAIMMLLTMLQFALFAVNSAPADAAFGGATAFEIDGNTSGADDWDGNAAVYDIVVTNDGGCANNAPENQIVPGTKLDDPWVVNTGQVLGKGDLCTVWTGSETTASGDAIFYFAWLRDFNQGEVTVYVPLDGSPFGSRAGDVLIKFEFDDNTKSITVTTLEWSETNALWGDEQPLGSSVDAAVSADTRFGEAAVNLTQSGILASDGCDRLVGARMITETGQAAANPTLKDVVDLAEPIVFNTCGAASLTVVKDVDVVGAPAVDFGFSVTGEADFTLADGESKMFEYVLDPASATVDLTVAESAGLPTYWSFVSVSCDNGVSGVAPSVDLTLADGDDVTCTFTNTYTPPNPAIDIQKTPDSQAVVVGGTATFTITVTNIGDVDLSNVTVTDAQAPGCDKVIGDLAVDASDAYQCSLANVSTGFTNVADVVGTPPVGPDVTDSDDAVVTVNAPSIDIQKTPDSQTVVVGGTATFTITVTNTGDVDLSNVTVTDVLSPDCDKVIGDLAVGASDAYECTLADVTADFTNVADVVGTPPIGPDVTDTDTADVDVIAPAIDIQKTPDSQAVVVGGTATFTITVTNIGDVDLSNVTVTDAQAPGCDKVIGDLAVDASDSYQCSLANVSTGFTNVADVVGTPPVGPDVTDSDDAVVTVNAPSIDIQKTPDSQTVVVGGTATFTITVTNTGDVDLSNVTVTDVLSPDCDKVIGDLAVGASDAYECTLADVTADFTNVADVVGTPPIGPDVTDTDTADVDVIAPAIDIQKTPDSQAVVVGGTATFTITVTNIGDVDLSNVTVTDAQAPGCDKVIGDLAVDASDAYQCSLANVSTGFTNVADVVGTPPVGPDVTDSDDAVVTVNAPSIDIQKTPDSQTVVVGGTATFTITVTNTGDVDLSNVTVTDVLSPDCDKVIGDLAVGASDAYECTLADVTADFTNVADVVGTPPIGPDVTDTDTADVDVRRPRTRDTTPQPTPTGSIGDYVWIDGDGDGRQDDFELPAVGVKVELLDSNGIVLETTTSDANGGYLFDDLEAGTYLVRFTVTDTSTVDFLFTEANAADVADDVDSDVVALPDANVGLTGTIVLAAGVDDLTVDAGVVLVDVQGIQIEPTTTTTVEPVTVGTLPFTGFEVEDMVFLSLGALAAGSVLLLAVSRREDEGAAEQVLSGWSNT